MENKNTIYLLIAIIVLMYFYFKNRVTATITSGVATQILPNSTNNVAPLLPGYRPPPIFLPPAPIVPPTILPPAPIIVNQPVTNVTPPTPATPLPHIPVPIIKTQCIPVTVLQAIQQAWKQVKNPSPHDMSASMDPSNPWSAIILANSFQLEITRLQNNGTCKGTANSGASDLRLEGSIGSLSLTALSSVSTVSSLTATAGTVGFAGAGTALGTAIPIIGIAIAGIIGIFSIISKHHAQAVGVEQGTECALLPAASNYLSLIDQAVSSGQATYQQGMDALDSLGQDFYNEALAGGQAGGLNNTGNVYCNALCEYWTLLTACIIYRKSRYHCAMVNAS